MKYFIIYVNCKVDLCEHYNSIPVLLTPRLFVFNSSSKLIDIEPTLVAPTADIEKKPEAHEPSKTTLSFV